MELLTIHHQDFTMSIECTKFMGIWGKAVQNVGKDKLTSKYTWSEGVEKVVKYNEGGQEEVLMAVICSLFQVITSLAVQFVFRP